MVGSYPRPLWFRDQLHGQDLLESLKLDVRREAFEDAVGVVIGDQVRAGLDVVSDGQMHFDDYGGAIGSFTWYWYERIPGFGKSKLTNPGTQGHTDGDEYGEERIAATVARAARMSGERILQNLVAEVKAFCRFHLHDDLTLVVIAAD